MPRNERTQKPIRIKRTPAEKEAIYALPLSAQFRIVHINAGSGFSVYQHLLVDPTAPDYRQVRAVAIAYTEECDCWINPEVDKNAPEGRKKIYPGITDNANPDLTTSYGYIEVKSPESKKNIVNRANLACRQKAIAAITDLAMKENLSEEEVITFSERIFSEKNVDQAGYANYTKDAVHWLIKGRLIKCNRPGKN